MSTLRALLRLEDKVAAEGRRLEHIGGPSMRRVAPLVLVLAAALHGAVLLLPAVRMRTELPASTPEPSLPLVWRPSPAAPWQPATEPVHGTLGAADVKPAPKRPARPPITRALTIEPVPEPPPELAMSAIAAAVEAIIPDPDGPPPSLDPGPPAGAVPAAEPEPAPSAIERVSPHYPEFARSLKAEGRVTLRLSVLPDGSVGDAAVEECTRRGVGFEAAALNAVKRWRYEPEPLRSRPRTVVVTIHFRQQDQRP